jgi:hypothetical protein
MPKESAIAKSQHDSLLKFAAERDLFKIYPELKEEKENIAYKIRLCLWELDDLERKKKNYKMMISEIDSAIQQSTEEKHQLAVQAYSLQEKGIFWVDDFFVVKKPADPNIDMQAMYKKLTPEQQEKYITRTTKIIEQIEVTIDWEKVVANEPIIYTKTNPTIAHKPKNKKTGDQNNE